MRAIQLFSVPNLTRRNPTYQLRSQSRTATTDDVQRIFRRRFDFFLFSAEYAAEEKFLKSGIVLREAFSEVYVARVYFRNSLQYLTVNYFFLLTARDGVNLLVMV